jgi:hypothetical protein
MLFSFVFRLNEVLLTDPGGWAPVSRLGAVRYWNLGLLLIASFVQARTVAGVSLRLIA